MAQFDIVDGPTKRTTTPYVTGTSVVAIRYKDGILLASDTLGSYGSLARYRQVSRLHALGDVLVGGSGDLSDFQNIIQDLEALRTTEYCHGDGVYLSARETWSYLSRRLYQRRNKMDPLWNQLVVAGFRDNKPFLGLVDLHGTNYEDVTIATGYGGHLARPLLRNAIDQYGPQMTKEQALQVVTDAMKVLFYRDCRTINRIQFATVTAEGVDIQPAVELETYWEFEKFVKADH
uniref:Proteasome subunit beta n=1 Tax=Arcella intermedia TaxID=1963864 RepID=A0A6B2LGJ7_9EUKA